ncbi:dihydrofolate reductase family protein [Microbacterium suaedae]|uniref:dihydrofolate reductase family protein n=1 Tax=Microbacterium suaedae TaxID=2067813 RepID=UPI000DA16D26|nr:dihydrofolate reductase family protein [Microbacterium suaedae]
MGTLVYSMQVSLDGYVADTTGEFTSWAMPDEQVLAAVNDEYSKVSTYLLGRRMYQMMAVWETNPEVIEQSPQSTEFARIWQRADKVVFSRTLETVATSRTQLRAQFDPEEVAEIKADARGNVTIDGPTVAAQAIRHGLVDRIDMLVCPVVVGGGLRFLPDRRLDLSLQHEQRFDNGMVQLRYDVITSREISA